MLMWSMPRRVRGLRPGIYSALGSIMRPFACDGTMTIKSTAPLFGTLEIVSRITVAQSGIGLPLSRADCGIRKPNPRFMESLLGRAAMHWNHEPDRGGRRERGRGRCFMKRGEDEPVRGEVIF